MKQKSTIYKPILWLIFDFTLISALSAIMEIFIYGYFHYGLSHGFINIHFQYYVPAFSIVIAVIFSVISILLLKKKISSIKLKSSRFPWLLFVLLSIFAAITKPLVQNWSDKKVMLLYDDLSKADYLSQLNFVKIFNTINYSSIGALWLLVILLVCYVWFLNRKATT
ncbi:hypothetical protein [uncultured Winogradskyella sp.]|uniref:hypothetical protein n=1 Tax=uncultured Winogradskyella sp. TaxID=395353 RepID=UPI0026077BA7|nr:hypothetical protein [uncultured Winogradskyella sp.]